ncbi:MAG: electron transport complex subunit E [Lachnospiraceae bacterium]|nr:electron transport complex subunit E [Lachnospiraceae bacterium]
MADNKKCGLGHEFTKGILMENPTFRLVLGTCPTLAVSTSVASAIGMGIAATIVLTCSNIAISALRKVIPDKVRIPAFIVIIASFVTVVQLLVKAFVPALDAALGVYLPLIVVNCIILGRAEAFASKNSVAASALDGLGMGIGFLTALTCMSTVREVLGSGTFLSGIKDLLAVFGDVQFNGFTIPFINSHPMTIFVLAPGGFFVFGIMIALANYVAEKNGKSKAELKGCGSCPMAATCRVKEEVGVS